MLTKNSYIIGFPRIGEHRELKKALEQYWSGKISAEELHKAAAELRKRHWLLQKEKGVEYISSNDFSYYDGMLDTAAMLNAIPARFMKIEDDLQRYFAMARGTKDLTALEMTKWFNTNYHYIVPELNDEINFRLNAEKIIGEYCEAAKLGIKTKINLIGPITFCGLSKTSDNKGGTFKYFDTILSVYKELFAKIATLDDKITIQLEEPLFAKAVPPEYLQLLKRSVTELCEVSNKIELIVMTYFEHSCEATEILTETPVWGIGLDFIYGQKNLGAIKGIKSKRIIAGVVDGKNIWKTDFNKALSVLHEIDKFMPREKILVSTSCSLLHLPFSVINEPESKIKQLLSFASEKIDEVVLLSKLFNSAELSGDERGYMHKSEQITAARSTKEDLPEIKPEVRKKPFAERINLQKERQELPLMPTTTIGSFPQTAKLRKLRRDFRQGIISASDYEAEIKSYIDDCIAIQEEIGLDVLVHGEPERNDMVEYFGEMLNGFHFTSNGWVQSYGSRCVKPPIIYSDISRQEPMTVKWITYAQSKTSKPVKGMLTGPVTIINWSFVRTDIPHSIIAMQIADALKEEISDLQESGIKIIQVDEAAFKEGYPLRKENVGEYEEWAVKSFRHTVSIAHPETQIHTHMCYSQFNDIIKTIEAMDADVITVETARSGNKLLRIFHDTAYKNEIGPGVYDIHSPRIPSVDEFKSQILLRLQVVDRSRMWVNPDCGLKTRKWDEVKPALINMIKATKAIRDSFM
ncbi:5-methyltetrahydropteroyltriglutamate--homocysteine S-methyltransferase [Thermodesulfovibrionales bacterium]|nr:5-methyltetrahydropteroyltriglutamate--homocysteine S-methyltransferase [Thermodesulfovibrionales bacterium]